MTPRARGQRAVEGGGLYDLSPGTAYTVMPLGFTHQWQDLNGDGEKQDTGRIWVAAYDKKYQSEEEFDREDPYRFHASALFLVVIGEDAGKTGKMGCPLQDLRIDPLGQAWELEYKTDKDKRSAFARLLVASGCGLEPGGGGEQPWERAIDEYVEAVGEANPHLFIPAPTEEQMAEHDLSGTPLLGMTREMFLMGLEAFWLEKSPVLSCKTKEDEGIFDYETLMATDVGLVPTVRANFARNGAVTERIAEARAIRASHRAVRVTEATPGMPWFEKVNDLEGASIPFLEDTGPEIIAKGAMWDHVRRIYQSLDQEGKTQVSSLLTAKEVVPGRDTFEAISFVVAEKLHKQIASLAPSVELAEDEQTVIGDAKRKAPEQAPVSL